MFTMSKYGLRPQRRPYRRRQGILEGILEGHLVRSNAALDARSRPLQCGRTIPKDLSVRAPRCAHGQIKVRRDVNAARNVVKWAVAGRSGSFGRQNRRLAPGARCANLGAAKIWN